MRLFSVALFVLFSSQLFAQDLYMPEYNFTLSDVSRRGHSKESIFQGLDRKLVRIGKSICSNRALVWGRQLEREYGVSSAKLFVFYSEKTGEVGDKTWWYHVAPVINDRGSLWVIDAGFPRFVKRPLTRDEWLKKFVGSTNCKELENDDELLIQNMFTMQRFPSITAEGVYDCYYRIASAPYWTPRTVALNLLQRNERGEPVTFYRDRFVENELMSACLEVASGGGLFGSSKQKRCRRFLGLSDEE